MCWVFGVLCVVCCVRGRECYVVCEWFAVSCLVGDHARRVMCNVLCSQLPVFRVYSHLFGVLCWCVVCVFYVLCGILIVCCV